MLRPTLVVAIALILASTAAAASTSTLHRRELRQSATLSADRGTLRFFRRRPELAATLPGRAALRFARAELAWVRRELDETIAVLRRREAARRVRVDHARIELSDGAEFACIHDHEGAWDANTGNGYYGGLQMDRRFQSQYGPEFVAHWGTADRWPVWAQVVAARRARDGYGGYKPRGYGPWPNTARACGLL